MISLNHCCEKYILITNIFFFDEIQNLSGWELFIDKLHRRGANLIITGSNAKMLTRELATSLTGRYVATEIFPFSFFIQRIPDY